VGVVIAIIVLPLMFVIVVTVVIVRVAAWVVRLVFAVALMLAAILDSRPTATR
jgi:hypothetical protein